MLQSVALLAERYQTEMAVGCRHVDLHALLHQRFFLQAIGNEITDRHQLQSPLVGLAAQLRQAGHRTVFIENLYQRGRWLQAGKARKVNGGFRMAGTSEHSGILGIERMDVARTAEHIRSGSRIGKRADCRGAVMGRDSSGAAREQVNRHGEGCSEHRSVVLDLTAEAKLATARERKRRTEFSAGVGDHEIDMISGHFLSCNYQIALVLAILIIYNYHELAFAEVGNRVFYTV